MACRLKIAIIFLAAISSSALSQEAEPLWVYFSGKGEFDLHPEEYYAAPALERRASLGLAPFEFSDLPVRQEYLHRLNNIVTELCGSSQWLNAALVLATSDQKKEVEQLPFVIEVMPSACRGMILAGSSESPGREFDKNLARQQLSWHEPDILKSHNIRGKGIRIAVFDGGFPGVDTHPAFKHLIDNNQIVATYDFAKKTSDVYKFNPHGTAVLSCIAGMADGYPSGMAPDAQFLLARTELSGEPWREELYWIQAAEWADKMGVHIISSSLGYTYHRYFVRDLTGRSTPVAVAANMAARKGILVINCIGNEGASGWRYAVTPADADSVLSVGGIDPETGVHINFSSYGPNVSGLMKPNVVASGKVIAAGRDHWKIMYGTSFSAPIIAGYAACAMQLYPGKSNMDIFELIQMTGHLYPYYDFAHGYGIPKASALFPVKETQDSLAHDHNIISAKIIKGEISVSIDPEAAAAIDPTDQYLYYHFRNKEDDIVKYGVYMTEPGQEIRLSLSASEDIASVYLRYRDNFKIIKAVR